MIYKIYSDSSIEPSNPGGILTYGVIAKKGSDVLYKEAEIIGWGTEATNNIGEATGVLVAMKWLLQQKEKLAAIIHSDSQLIVNQCTGEWRCNDAKLKPIIELIRKGKRKYGKTLHFKWIPRTENSEADELSRTPYTEELIETYKKHKLDIEFKGDDITF